MKKVLVISLLVFICFGSLAAIAFFGGDLLAKSATTPTPVPDVLLIDQGVVMVHSNIRAIVGVGNLAMHVCPEDQPYLAATQTDDLGIRHFWVPRSLPATLSSLTLEEGQEYILRRLIACGSCQYDTAAESIDPVMLEKMAGDAAVRRTGEPSSMMYFALESFAKYALDSQRQVAESGFDAIQSVAISADAAQTTTATAGFSAACVPWFALAVVVVAVMYALSKKSGK